MKIRILIILFLLTATYLLNAQVSATAKTDKSQYLIGDYIRVQLNVTADSTYVLDWPAENDLTSYDLITSNPIDTTRINNAFHLSQEIVYSIYDSGVYYLPQIKIPYKKLRDTTTYFVFSDSALFIVQTVPVDTTLTIKPIKEVIEVKVINYTWIFIVCGLLLFTGIGVIIYFVFFKNKIKIAIKEKVNTISYYDKTIQLLKELDANKLWQKDDLKQYYSELTEILRSYMEKRFGINALESTSDEIIAQLNNVDLSAVQIEYIRFILELADLVKFAKSRPLQNENIQAMQNAFAFVETTKPADPKPDLKQ